MKTAAYVIVSLALLVLSLLNVGSGLFATLGVARALSTRAAFPIAPQKPRVRVVRTQYGGGGGGYFGGK